MWKVWPIKAKIRALELWTVEGVAPVEVFQRVAAEFDAPLSPGHTQPRRAKETLKRYQAQIADRLQRSLSRHSGIVKLLRDSGLLQEPDAMEQQATGMGLETVARAACETQPVFIDPKTGLPSEEVTCPLCGKPMSPSVAQKCVRYMYYEWNRNQERYSRKTFADQPEALVSIALVCRSCRLRINVFDEYGASPQHPGYYVEDCQRSHKSIFRDGRGDYREPPSFEFSDPALLMEHPVL